VRACVCVCVVEGADNINARGGWSMEGEGPYLYVIPFKLVTIQVSL